MLKWFSNEEGAPGQDAPGSPQGAGGGGPGADGPPALSEVAERLTQTEQLVAQLKELIRGKDTELHAKDQQLKAEEAACNAKLSKMRLQNKAKVTSLTAQLEELKKQQAPQSADPDTPTHSRKGGAEGGEQEHAAASRGKILRLRKKVEELEQQLSQREEQLGVTTRELEAQRRRGEDMDAMLVEKDRKLAEKEAYIVHLQTAVSGEHPATPAQEQQVCAVESGSLQDLQTLVQNLTRKVGEGEERYSLLQEQTGSLQELLVTNTKYEEKENMYKQNIQTFKDIILQKDNVLTEVNQRHEQELFKLAAKSDASADLEQLLKALKQKLHEKEEVLLGKTQVIDVLQGELDGRDQQIKDLAERMRRLQVERESLQSKLEAEKHVMRAQLRDLMEKHQGELRRAADKHQAELAERQQQLEELRDSSASSVPPSGQADAAQEGSGGDAATDSATAKRIKALEAQAKLKSEEASKSEGKFLKMKAWSKSRIRQLEDELRKSQSGSSAPDLTSLRSRITDLEEEREEMLMRLDQYEEIQAKNDLLVAKLVVYEEQQRKMQADLEQVTKRAASQASESGSADDTQSQVLEWQEMVSEAVTARDRARDEKATMVLRLSHMEEEREALASRQQELEEELAQAQARGLGSHRGKKLGGAAQRSLQEDFEFDVQQSFPDVRSASESTTPMEGENMGGWWPEYSTPDPEGLRSVVEELELERNQLQEQILGLEERCQDLEDRLQLQARIETLQNESERLHGQLTSLRSQQGRDAEKHQLLVTNLNDQLQGLSDTQECLETSLIEKENTLAKTSEKLELIDSLRDSLKEKEAQYRDVSDKLLQTEHNLTDGLKKCSMFEKQSSELKAAVTDLTQRLTVLKDKTQKQETTIETLQNDLDQTNDELDKLNSTHLEERAQLIHDLQSCEREIDNLKDTLSDKDKELSVLSGNMAEYVEQIAVLKQEMKHKEEDLVRSESARSKAEREAQIIRGSQDADQQSLNTRMAELAEQLKDTEGELGKAKEESVSSGVTVVELTKRVEEDKRTIQDLRGEVQKQNVSHRDSLLECDTRISSLKEQMTVASEKIQEFDGVVTQLRDEKVSNENLKDQLQDKEQTYERELKSFKEERNTLLAEAAKHNNELQSLSTKLEEQVECREQVKQVMREKVETISYLEEKMMSTQKEAEDERQKFSTELKARDSEKENLRKELQGKTENISKLKTLLKNMKSEKQQLHTNLKGKTEELQSQKKRVDDLTEKASAALNVNTSVNTQVSNLTAENKRLQQEVAEKDTELTKERDSLQNSISASETQHSENSKVIEGLLKDKEELCVRANELNSVLEQNKQSFSANLLEKTNECSDFTKTLRENEEAVAHLQEQVDTLNTQITELHQNMAEKEKTVTDQNSQIEAQQNHLGQLQETMSLLQEQGSALKSGLTEKDATLQQKTEECGSLQHEMVQQKELVAKLQGEIESFRGECSQLSQRLVEREETLGHTTLECQNHKDELNKRNESLMSLSSQLGVMNENASKLESENMQLKTTLKNHVEELNKLKREMDQRQAEVVGFHGHIRALSEQNHQLRAACEIREKELAQQMQVASELDGRLTVTLEQNTNLSSHLSRLAGENERLQQELAQKVESISELVETRSALQDKISSFEMQRSENRKIIEGLLKDKEEVSVATGELNNALERNKQSASESFLEKSNECSDLVKSLRGSEEKVIRLKEQVDRLSSQVNQLNNNMAEKEKTVTDQNSQIEAQQNHLGRLQETMSLLQEQGSALKSGLVEKDATLQQKTEECGSLQNEMVQQKELVAKLQGEIESFRGECSQLSQRLVEREETLSHTTLECQNHKDELNKRNESLMSLSGQLGVMNENASKLESENMQLKTTLKNHVEELNKLKQEMDQRQAEVVDLRDNVQVLNEQNVRLKTELQNSVSEMSKTFEEMSVLRADLSNRDSRVSDLMEQLTAASSDKESLSLTLQQRDESLKQQEMFMKQLQAKLEEGEGQKSQTTEVITELQTQAQGLQKCLHDKGVSLHETEKALCLLREKFTSDSLQFRSQVENLTSESSVLKDVLKEKEQAVCEAQSTTTAVSESLNSKLKAKESECESLKEQLSDLQQSVSQLNNTLAAQSTDQTKALQDVQRRADEAALFKAQSIELVSQLKSQIQELSSESANLSKSADEKQSAFVNLQEKYAAHLEELQNIRKQLSQRTEEMSSLNKALRVSNGAVQAAESTIEALKNESSLLRQELHQIQELNVDLSKQKEDALAIHQKNTSSLTVEIERLKSQHQHVAAQVNALTENLEQREMALHAINSQYTAQVKQAEQVVSQVQKLEEQNTKLREAVTLSKQEHRQQVDAAVSEKEHLHQEVQKLTVQRDELGRNYSIQIQTMQEQLNLQKQQQSSSMNEVMEKMMAEKARLQVEVSVKGEEITKLKLNIEKIEHTLQDSEQEWLSLLDRETQDKNLLVEQLKSVENEMKSKDFKVQALQQDLDHLHEKLSEAASALKQGSNQLREKELEASASRVQLEHILVSVQEKDEENVDLRRALQDMESELRKLEVSKECSDKDLSILSQTMSDRLVDLEDEKACLKDTMTQLRESHQSELDSLRGELENVSEQFKQTERTLNESEMGYQSKNQQVVLLQEKVQHIQAQMQTETESLRDASVEQTALFTEVQTKDEKINCMTIQISQQKELLAGLSQQLREKDASIAQVMESASNERMKHAEEKSNLILQLESVEDARSNSVKQLENVSMQLEEGKEHLSLSDCEIKTKNTENEELTKEKDNLKTQLAKVSKEKEAMKKKLQAALVVRKDLLKKIEDLTSQAQANTKDHEAHIALLKQQILQKEGELHGLAQVSSEREGIVNQLESNIHISQTKLDEHEACLTTMQHTLNEKSNIIEQLYSSISEKEEAFEQERHDMMLKLEQLQDEMKKREESTKQEMSCSTATDIEKELATVKQEKAVLQKRAQALQLARKETMKKSQEREKQYNKELSELKDDFKTLQAQHCQQTDELNAVQLRHDQNIQKLEEDINKAKVSHLDELEILRQTVEERDTTLKDLKMSLAEMDIQAHSSSAYQVELETLHFKLESMSSEMAMKDKIQVELEQRSKVLIESLELVRNELEKAHAEIKEKMQEQQQAIQIAEQKNQQQKQTMVENVGLQNQLSTSQAIVEELKHTLEELFTEKNTLLSESKALMEERDQMRQELEDALAHIAQQSSKLQSFQNTLAETQQQLCDEKEALKEELEKAQSCYVESQTEMESSKLHMESLQQEKESAFVAVEQLKDEVAMLDAQLKEAEKVNEDLLQKLSGLQGKSLQQEKLIETSAELAELDASIKEGDDSLLISQAVATEKEELIAALEQQLQRQIHLHGVAMEKMGTEVDELRQRSREDTSKIKDQDNQSKMALLTKKLQAALISRKEILKESSLLKEQIQTLSAKHEHIETSSAALEMSIARLKQQKEDLESSLSSLSKEKEKLSTDVDRILNDNHNLSAACDSLKRTIENITQQKQAFSCQLESLNDSQTEELSEWKSKHAELKQEYESLLQAYENVSSEMDKMRQLLEGARRERQEALFKAHKSESERESLEKQVSEMEDENEIIKDEMRTFAEANQQKIEELEEENQTIKKDLQEFTFRNQKQQTEIHRLKESSEELTEKLTAIQLDNGSLAEELREASASSVRWLTESKACENNIQCKLDEALNLNNSLTAQIRALKTELAAQQEISELMQKQKQNLSETIKQIQNDHDVDLGGKDCAMAELQDVINRHIQETISLNEKVKILEDDKSLLQEELENVQEISDAVKNENEYLESVGLQNSERIDELIEAINVLQAQSTHLSNQLTASKDEKAQVCKAKEEQQLKLVKEFEEKLKMVQRGNQGSQNVKKELQELLKEKHHEMNQLQHDCIKYQELILDLERSLKASESACKQLEKELKELTMRVLSGEESRRHLEAELITHKNLLSEAKKDVACISSEKDQLITEVSERTKLSEFQITERTKALENVAKQQESVYMKRQMILQKQMEELQDSNERESHIVVELRRQIDSQDLQMHTLKREAETNSAKLAALSFSPQAADAMQSWNDLFEKTLHEKDNQLLEQGFVIKRFLEETRVKEKEVNEMQVTKSRLERALGEYTVAANAQQRQLFVMGASNTELSQSVELLRRQLQGLSSHVERLEQDKSVLNRQLKDETDSTSQTQLNLQQLEKTQSDTESQLLLSQSHNDKRQVDFEKQEAISLHLKSLLQNKDAEISSLLSSRDGQMSGYLEQLQANHGAQVTGYEDRLTALYYGRGKADGEFRRLESKVKTLQVKLDKSVQEKEQTAAKMETFRNSMVSLQTEKDNLMSEYRILEAQNQAEIKVREGSVEGDLNATKGLKHEIRTLLHQMDDLNSENAMLKAQLIRYREDLNQVLSLKDNQLKELLKKQQDTIKNLDNQKSIAEKQHRETLLQLKGEGQANDALKVEKSKLQTLVAQLEADMLALKKQWAETNESKVIADLQQAVAAKAAECNSLQQKLFAQKVASDDLKTSLQQLESETDKKLGEADDKYNSELDAFEREADQMRNERETADQSMTELATDLLQTEELLTEARGQNKDLKSQNESLGKAMAALQNNRDQLIEDFKILRNRYDDELRDTQAAMSKVEHRLGDATSELANLAKERHILVQKYSALESRDAYSQLTTLVDELSGALSQKEGELKRVSLENDTYGRQVSAFSRSMASLQDDRDRLMEALAEARGALEPRQGSGPGAVNSVESNSHRSSIDALQTETEGLEMRQRMDELQSELQQAQAYRQQTVQEVNGYQAELAKLRSERGRLQSECQALKEMHLAGERKVGYPVKETMALVGKDATEDPVAQLRAERVQLQRDLQRCLSEIQQRDLHCQQINVKLQQAVEEKGGVSSQLRAVSQTLRDTQLHLGQLQNRCYWLESQTQATPNQHSQGSVSVEVAPGAPQERTSAVVDMDTMEAGELRARLMEVEQSVTQLSQSLAEERTRREDAEEALGLAEERAKSVDSSPSRSAHRDFSIQLETEEEWAALILDPNEPVLTRKMKGGVLACRQWLRGRSLYCSKLLTSRARSRYFFLAYLLTLHIAVLMCLTGAL